MALFRLFATDRGRRATGRARRAALATLLCGALGSAYPQSRDDGRDDGRDWPSYNRDLASTRYSPLDSIDAGNVASLREAWRFRLGRSWTTGTLTGGSEFTPIVIDGVMYLATAEDVVALEAHTGREIWRYRREQGAPPPSHRGIGYWPGDASHPARVFFTAARLLVGIAPGTGERAYRCCTSARRSFTRSC
jgi:glucose dehydrogenase